MYKKIKTALTNKKGSLLWELMLVLLILFVVIYTVVTFIGVYSQYEKMTYAAKTVARNIEVTGVYDEAQANADFVSLIGASAGMHLTPGHSKYCTMTEISDYDPAYTTAELANQLKAKGKIQLGQKFTLRYNATFDWEVANLEIGGNIRVIKMPVPMSYEVTGMSEVFFRSADD